MYTMRIKKKERINFITKLFICSVFLLNLIGILLLFSAEGGNFTLFAKKQLLTFLFLIPVVFFIRMINFKILFASSYYIYLLCLSTLILANFIGYNAMGAQRWISIGFVNIQPGEFMKIAIILALAKYFHKLHFSDIKTSVSSFVIPLVIIALPVALLLKQPNLGTAIIVIMLGATIFFTVGVKIKNFIFVICSMFIALPFIWRFMHLYQKKRILTFLYPEKDPLGAGYNIIQSKIAIGSGGIIGKGLLHGTQNQLSFLPENHTDFIFTILCEEIGFLGSIFVIMLYFILILSCYLISIKCLTQFSRLIIIGFACLVFFHVFINIGMISGILPVVGTPLPFLSYGGSNLTAFMIGAGLVLNAEFNKRLTIVKFGIV